MNDTKSESSAQEGPDKLHHDHLEPQVPFGKDHPKPDKHNASPNPAPASESETQEQDNDHYNGMSQ